MALAAVAKQGESFHDIAVLLTDTDKNKRTELHCSVRFFVGPEKNQTYWCPDKRLTESHELTQSNSDTSKLRKDYQSTAYEERPTSHWISHPNVRDPCCVPVDVFASERILDWD